MTATDAILLPPGALFSAAQRWLQRLWIFALYAGGLALWVFFLNFGQFRWGVQDWIWEWRYSRILKEALTSGVLPLHTDPNLVYGVARFLGIPDVPLGVQIPLLLFMDVGSAFLLHWLFMYSVSFAGCLLLRSRHGLSIAALTIVAVLFNFNGFITSHLGIGHTFFIGYFFFPFFVMLVLELVKGQAGQLWFAWMALVLFGMELLGTAQLFAACVMFLGLLAIFARGSRGPLLKSVVLGILLHAFRIAPAALSLSGYYSRPLPGYLTLGDLLQALTWIVPAGRADKFITGLPVGWWELDMYVGIVGLLGILYFGVWRSWKRLQDGASSSLLPPLGVSLLVFAVLSIGYLYWPINYLPIPLWKLVHVPSRFLLLPLLFLGALAALELQAWLDARRPGPWTRFAVIGAVVVFMHDLFQHARVWRVEHVYESFPEAPLDYGLRIATHSDPTYVMILVISGLVSLLSLGYIVRALLLARRERPSGRAP
jgi:hypothetical protein